MKRLIVSLLIFVSIPCLSYVLCVLHAPEVRATTLSAGVDHAEYLPAITPQMAANINASTTRAPALDWFPIPGFMAGVWSKKGDLTISESDASGYTRPINQWTENEMNVSWGTQTDKQGDVWHLNLLPSTRIGNTGNMQVRFVTTFMKCELTNATEMITRTRYLITETMSGTSQVVNEFQQESLNRYTLLPDGQLQNESSNRMYTLRGIPERSGVLDSKFRRIGPFTPVASGNGIDYLESLNEYLREHNLSQLQKTQTQRAE